MKTATESFKTISVIHIQRPLDIHSLMVREPTKFVKIALITEERFFLNFYGDIDSKALSMDLAR